MKLWISLLQVRALPGSDNSCEGAYVYGVTPADSAAAAAAAFGLALWEIGWRLVSTEETCEFVDALPLLGVDSELRRLAEDVERAPGPRFGVFHAWAESMN